MSWKTNTQDFTVGIRQAGRIYNLQTKFLTKCKISEQLESKYKNNTAINNYNKRETPEDADGVWAKAEEWYVTNGTK